MTTIQLPKLPKGKEFEEYISAFMQLGGYYIERNIIERDIIEVLELDILSTNYDTIPPTVALVEARSGDWGFSDLFKVCGWMQYLHIPRGKFITNREQNNIDFFKKKAEILGIELIVIPSLDDSKEVLSKILPELTPADIDENDIEVWRYSYWVERRLLERLIYKKKSHPDKKCFRALADYYYETNSGIFFTDNIIEKVAKLYSVFMNFPHITAKTGHELIGEDFEDEYEKLPDEIYQAYLKCEDTDINICTFLEHKARLAILKNAVDYKLYKDAGVPGKTDDVTKSMLGFEFNLIESLPSSFKQGLDTISKHKYFHRYPVFWQWFMWIFGGFILKDYEEKEYEILSQKTGIPRDEIPNAFTSYQVLFPLDDGWFTDLYPHSEIKIIKMFPMPFRGVGANYRRGLYLENGNDPITSLEVSGAWTKNELIKWNNLAVHVLE